MEAITEAESVIEMVREYMSKYRNFTEAFDTTANDSPAKLVTGMVCEDLDKYEDCTEAVTGMACEDLENHENLTKSFVSPKEMDSSICPSAADEACFKFTA